MKETVGHSIMCVRIVCDILHIYFHVICFDPAAAEGFYSE